MKKIFVPHKLFMRFLKRIYKVLIPPCGVLVILGGALFLLQVVVVSDVAATNTEKHTIRVQYLTYEVIKVQQKSITIRDRKGRVIFVTKEPKGLNVGDMVRYDRLRFKLKRYPKK